MYLCIDFIFFTGSKKAYSVIFIVFCRPDFRREHKYPCVRVKHILDFVDNNQKMAFLKK